MISLYDVIADVSLTLHKTGNVIFLPKVKGSFMLSFILIETSSHDQYKTQHETPREGLQSRTSPERFSACSFRVFFGLQVFSTFEGCFYLLVATASRTANKVFQRKFTPLVKANGGWANYVIIFSTR